SKPGWSQRSSPRTPSSPGPSSWRARSPRTPPPRYAGVAPFCAASKAIFSSATSKTAGGPSATTGITRTPKRARAPSSTAATRNGGTAEKASPSADEGGREGLQARERVRCPLPRLDDDAIDAHRLQPGDVAVVGYFGHV